MWAYSFGVWHTARSRSPQWGGSELDQPAVDDYPQPAEHGGEIKAHRPIHRQVWSPLVENGDALTAPLSEKVRYTNESVHAQSLRAPRWVEDKHLRNTFIATWHGMTLLWAHLFVTPRAPVHQNCPLCFCPSVTKTSSGRAESAQPGI